MNDKLALLGGNKTIQSPFKRYNSIGEEEVIAAKSVVETGVLSKFLGCWDDDFYGGEKVQAFERACEIFFSTKHAVSVNSNTSGLIAALGAIGLEPGDEVIVSPWTMCATATSILVWNAIPVFADIETETFNLSPESIKRCITGRTKAILVTDIFGHAADLSAIMQLAEKHSLKVIEDAAQAPAAQYKGKYVGTLADIGVFSFNYHKHVHTGEGGMCVTNNDELAERMQLIRNHAEAVVEAKGVTNISNMIGFNFRLGEIEAAIGLEQLKKLTGRVKRVMEIAERLTSGIRDLNGLLTPVIKENCTHVFYVYPLVYEEETTGVSRERVVEALRAEGVSVSNGYQNIHLLPMFQQKIAYGQGHFPWTLNGLDSVSYEKGICPIAEEMHDKKFIALSMCLFEYSNDDIDLMIKSFHKVWSQLDAL